VPLDTKR
jgi:hypothetical protein